MAKGYYKDLTKLLKENGYDFWKKAKGSHEKWQHNETGIILVVPHNLKRKHTANSILKDAGIDHKF